MNNTIAQLIIYIEDTKLYVYFQILFAICNKYFNIILILFFSGTYADTSTTSN